MTADSRQLSLFLSPEIAAALAVYHRRLEHLDVCVHRDEVDWWDVCLDCECGGVSEDP